MGKGTSHAKGRLVSGKDRSYRPPRSDKVKAVEASSRGDSCLPTNESEIQVDGSSEDTAAHGIPCSVLDIDHICCAQHPGIGHVIDGSTAYRVLSLDIMSG
jgi:hypothetical protein